jgi:hypothetical protein
MGTRGVVGFHVNGKDKVSYNHSDSYPSGLGAEVLAFIQGTSLAEIKKTAERIILIDEDIPPTPEQIKDCEPWTDLGVSSQSTSDWYCLLRGAQGDLSAYTDGLKYMPDSNSFLLDSLFCEYAYIINTDEQVLEFYSGFNKKSRLRKGRYAAIQSEPDSNYYGVALIKKYPLEDILAADEDEIKGIIKEMEKKSSSFYNNQEKEIKKKKAVTE